MKVKKELELVLLLHILIVSCNQHSERVNVNVDGVHLEDVSIERYEKELFTIDKSNLKNELKRIQPQYSVFLEGDLEDTLDLIRLSDYLNDTLLINVFNESEEIITDIQPEEQELTDAFRHYLYYFPEVELPVTFTYISGFDYQNPVQLYGNNLLISIDMYLGADYPRYKYLGVPLYVLQRFDRNYIVRDCMFQLANQRVNPNQVGNSLLDKIILQGKLLWFVNAMIPDIPKSTLLNYSHYHLKWAQDNEASIWAFLIENELLFTTELQPYQKFILDSPFTSYFGDDSPPRLGWWIGYRIVDSYMNKNQNVELNELLKNSDTQSILNNSGYKPRY